MGIAIKTLILLIAALHLFILWIEMFGWLKHGQKIVPGGNAAFFTETKPMAANQGLYNGFLAAGLLWSLFIRDAVWSQSISLFFLGCVATAGIYGAITANRSIFFKQALPAIVAIILIIIL